VLIVNRQIGFAGGKVRDQRALIGQRPGATVATFDPAKRQKMHPLGHRPGSGRGKVRPVTGGQAKALKNRPCGVRLRRGHGRQTVDGGTTSSVGLVPSGRPPSAVKACIAARARA